VGVELNQATGVGRLKAESVDLKIVVVPELVAREGVGLVHSC